MKPSLRLLALDLSGHAFREGDRFLTNPRHLCPP